MRSLARRAIPVAALAAAVVAVMFVLASTAINLFVASRLTSDLDQRISERLEGLRTAAAVAPLPRSIQDQDHSFEAPLLFWQLDSTGRVVQSSPNSPAYPPGLQVSTPSTTRIAGTDFRLASAGLPSGRLVVGESTASISNSVRLLVTAELVVGPSLAILVFLGGVLIGWRVAGPIERARQEQLAFTADASHELRTPVSVIEAETSLALRRERDAPAYRAVLERVAGEADRLRRIIEDLLILARADALPSLPTTDAADLGQMAQAAAERFGAIASARSLNLSLDVPRVPTLVAAPAEWVERLLGILLDNACRYAPDGGQVKVSVRAHRGRWRLGVEDNGPGIPAEEQKRVFRRFHRASAVPGGAGLGLAIADALVRASQGHWETEPSLLGGARMVVSWPRASTKAPADPSRSATLNSGRVSG
ncbi:MAG: HAMP domain-containing sensor histidine kinase [Candidatus Dormibacter sp.]